MRENGDYAVTEGARGQGLTKLSGSRSMAGRTLKSVVFRPRNRAEQTQNFVREFVMPVIVLISNNPKLSALKSPAGRA